MCVVDAEKQDDMKKSQVKMLLFTLCEINFIFHVKNDIKMGQITLIPVRKVLG